MFTFVVQLKDAETDADIQVLLADQSTLDILSQCGISSVVNVSRSHVYLARKPNPICLTGNYNYGLVYILPIREKERLSTVIAFRKWLYPHRHIYGECQVVR